MTGEVSSEQKHPSPRVLCIFSNPGSWGHDNIIAGGEIRTVEILQRWHRWGVKVESLETIPSPSLTLQSGYPVHTVSIPLRGYRAFTLLVNTIIMFYKYVRTAYPLRHRFDFIVTSSSNLLDVAPAWFMSKLWGKPFAVVVQVSCYASSFRATYRLMRDAGEGIFHSVWMTLTAGIALRLARRASALFCLSQPIADILLNMGFKNGKIHVTGMGLDHVAIDSVPACPRDIDVVYLGRVEKHKGVGDLLDAWKMVSAARSGSSLVVVGAGTYLDEAKRQATAAGLDKHVEFPGFAASPEKYAYLKRSKVFVYPSMISEGWGLAIAEALACGLPVVCTDNPVFKGVFGECAAVSFTPVNNPEALAAAILDLLRSDARLKTAGETACAYAQQYDWDTIAGIELDTIRSQTGVPAAGR